MDREIIDNPNIQDIWADGIARVEVVGTVCRSIYFRWQLVEGVWRRVVIDAAIVKPAENFPQRLRACRWPFPIVEMVAPRDTGALLPN
jgi:hypothetical protein